MTEGGFAWGAKASLLWTSLRRDIAMETCSWHGLQANNGEKETECGLYSRPTETWSLSDQASRANYLMEEAALRTPCHQPKNTENQRPLEQAYHCHGALEAEW
ncbi:unnamed protein product [Natator depressus]